MCQSGYVVFDRFSACLEDTTGVIAIDNSSGAQVGEVDVQFAIWHTLANNSRSWDENAFIAVTNEAGVLAGNTSLSAPVQCNGFTPGDCFITAYDWPLETQQALMDPVGASWVGTASFTSTDPGIDFQRMGLTLNWTTTNPDANPNSSTVQIQSGLTQRCDNTLPEQAEVSLEFPRTRQHLPR